MKKILLVATTLFVLAILFASCRKTRTCVCDSFEYELSHLNKPEARIVCSAYGEECVLK